MSPSKRSNRGGSGTGTGGGGAGGTTTSNKKSKHSKGSSHHHSRRSSSSSLLYANTHCVMDFLQTVLSRQELQNLYLVEQDNNNDDSAGNNKNNDNNCDKNNTDNNNSKKEEVHLGAFVCRAVLQQLPQVSQQIVMRLSCTGGNFPVSGIQIWLSSSSSKNSGGKNLHQALEPLLKELYSWAIIQEIDPQKNVVSLTLPFYKGLRKSLTSLHASPWMPLSHEQITLLEQQEAGGVVVASPRQQPPITPEVLEQYTNDQWDAVLHYLVGSSGHAEPPTEMVTFLLQTGLMQRDSADNAEYISQKGYDFMLQDHHQQIWHFVVQYLQSIGKHNKKELRREAILFLIALSFGRVGAAYNSTALSINCRTMMKDLSYFGLLYIRKIGKTNTTIFYPTNIATQLVHNSNNNSSSNGSGSTKNNQQWSNKALSNALSQPNPTNSSHLAIIVQTNFQVCAYTTSDLHVSMLGLFCDLKTIRRLPNVVMLRISRDSVKAAFTYGIQAQQILRFLEQHAHPRLLQQSRGRGGGRQATSALPDNVVDQIWLWHRELTRVIFTKVYQHQVLMGNDEFHAVKEFAEKKHALSWCSEARNKLFIDYKHVETVQNFVQQWRAQKAAQQGR